MLNTLTMCDLHSEDQPLRSRDEVGAAQRLRLVPQLLDASQQR